MFRVCLALILLVDIRIRFGDLWAFYADWGVMPRSFLIEEIASPFKFSFHLINGFGLFQGFLMMLAFVIALALLVGYRTRLATILSWIFLYSLQVRNPAILQGGDSLILVSLFWAMFLPLGATYSLDRALDSSANTPPQRIFSGGSVALVAQVVIMYFFAAALKNGPDWILDNSAVYYALNIDIFTRSFGRFLLNYPDLLKCLTWMVLWFERLGPFLLLTPVGIGVIRTLGVFLFVLLHVGMGSAMRLGPFPFIGITSALVFLPSAFWDRFLSWSQNPRTAHLKIYYDADCGFCKKSVQVLKTFFLLPGVSVLPAQNFSEIYHEMQDHNSWVVRDHENKNYYQLDAFLSICRASPFLWPLSFLLRLAPFYFVGTQVYRAVASHRARASRLVPLPSFKPLVIETPRWADGTAIVLIFYVFLLNLGGMDYFKIQKWIKIPAGVLCLSQRWGMFAPVPDHLGGWHVFYGRLKNGNEIDLFRGGKPIDWNKPPDVSLLYKNERWRKYMYNFTEPSGVNLRPYLADYLCLEWNRKQKDVVRKIERVEICFMKQPTPSPGLADPEPKKVLLWGEDCPNRTK